MRKIEKEEEQLSYDDSEKKIYHLCIVNLVIGWVSLYSSFIERRGNAIIDFHDLHEANFSFSFFWGGGGEKCQYSTLRFYDMKTRIRHIFFFNFFLELCTAPRVTTSSAFPAWSNLWSRTTRNWERTRGTMPRDASCRWLRTWPNTWSWWKTRSCKSAFSSWSVVKVSVVWLAQGWERGGGVL